MRVGPIVLALWLIGCGRIGFDESGLGSSEVDASAGDGGAQTSPDGATPGDGAVADGQSSCASSYDLSFGSSRYRLSGSGASWVAAESDCESDGGHLVVIDDMSENDFVQATVVAARTWIGVSDRITETTFLSVTGGVPGFDRWIGGTPPLNVGEDCAQILLDGTWDDGDCAAAFPLLCECDGVPVDPSTF